MKKLVKLIYLGFVVFLPVHQSAVAQGNYAKDAAALPAEIRKQLTTNALDLYYPHSVLRLYAQNQFASPWLKPQAGFGTTWQAMLMLDCVLQFGLCHDDYHPKELSYTALHHILEQPGTVSIEKQARFDIMLTDAVINFMNNLHYGKLNPEFPADKIDNLTSGFNAVNILGNAFNSQDFIRAIADVQPKSKLYEAMQYHMRLWTGLYAEDCYEIPESDIRLLAINMERLRWAGADTGVYIRINIPAYSLTLYEPDSAYQFKVIVGKPGNTTPALQSQVRYFTTAPEWKVPQRIFRKELLPRALRDSNYFENNHFAVYDKKAKYVEPTSGNLSLMKNNPGNYHITQSSGCDNALGLIVFRFPNVYDIYLHDTPQKNLFNKEARDFSHGCIRVENAGALAALLLKYDGNEKSIPALNKAITKYKTRNFNLQRAVPIKIIYLTCEVNKGKVFTYKDIYDLDERLEMAFYHTDQQLTIR